MSYRYQGGGRQQARKTTRVIGFLPNATNRHSTRLARVLIRETAARPGIPEHATIDIVLRRRPVGALVRAEIGIVERPIGGKAPVASRQEKRNNL